jgi:hypothetical protein
MHVTTLHASGTLESSQSNRDRQATVEVGLPLTHSWNRLLTSRARRSGPASSRPAARDGLWLAQSSVEQHGLRLPSHGPTGTGRSLRRDRLAPKEAGPAKTRPGWQPSESLSHRCGSNTISLHPTRRLLAAPCSASLTLARRRGAPMIRRPVLKHSPLPHGSAASTLAQTLAARSLRWAARWSSQWRGRFSPSMQLRRCSPFRPHCRRGSPHTRAALRHRARTDSRLRGARLHMLCGWHRRRG